MPSSGAHGWQSVEHPTLAQVMISWFMGSSPALGSVQRAQILQPTSDSVSPSLSAPSWLALCLSLSKINKHLKKGAGEEPLPVSLPGLE